MRNKLKDKINRIIGFITIEWRTFIWLSSECYMSGSPAAHIINYCALPCTLSPSTISLTYYSLYTVI